MNRTIKTVWLLAIVALTLSCNGLDKSDNNNVAKEQDTSKPVTIVLTHGLTQKTSSHDLYTKAAIETCNCIQPMLEKAKQLKEFEANKQIEDKKKVSIEMVEIQPQVQKCSDEIHEKYSKINRNIDEKRMFNALKTHCPDMSTLFSNFNIAK